MIQDGVPQSERLKRLNEIAIHQMRVLSSGGGRNLEFTHFLNAKVDFTPINKG